MVTMESSLTTSLAGTVRTAREGRGMTVTALAERSGVSRR